MSTRKERRTFWAIMQDGNVDEPFDAPAYTTFHRDPVAAFDELKQWQNDLGGDSDGVQVVRIDATLMIVTSPTDGERSVPPKTIRNAICSILRDQQKPMHTRALLAQLQAAGVTVPGKDPARNLSAHLSNDARFCPCECEDLKRGYWGLRSWREMGGER